MTRLCLGRIWLKAGSITIPALKNMYGFMKVGADYKKGYGPRAKCFTTLDSEQLIDMSFAEANLGLKWGNDTRWHKALSKIDFGYKKLCT